MRHSATGKYPDMPIVYLYIPLLVTFHQSIYCLASNSLTSSWSRAYNGRMLVHKMQDRQEKGLTFSSSVFASFSLNLASLAASCRRA